MGELTTKAMKLATGVAGAASETAIVVDTYALSVSMSRGDEQHDQFHPEAKHDTPKFSPETWDRAKSFPSDGWGVERRESRKEFPSPAMVCFTSMEFLSRNCINLSRTDARGFDCTPCCAVHHGKS